jgi:hypothetical protein
MVSLQYDITKADYVSFYTFIFWEEGKKKRRLNFLKQAGFLLIFLGILYFAGGRGSFNFLSITIYAVIFFSVMLPLLNGKHAIIKNAEKITDDAENASIFTSYNLVATDTDLFIKNSFVETRYFWNAIIKKSETNTHYFLFENALQAIIIPKTACRNEEERLALSKILSKNLTIDAEFNQMLT